ncbi:MAG: hypothetical protein COW89_03195 [Nitrospinae bacterium CG22_combo_CG10-13_8_21_14_all_47_10]|nr:MAG: hypothetical protein COW89_03195 [Nitrospinae bacterium CG22_combo_CG10-13_8_21_14_all_47_10]
MLKLAFRANHQQGFGKGKNEISKTVLFHQRALRNPRLPVPGTKAKVKYHVFADAQNDMQKPSCCHPDEPWRRRISLFLNTEPLTQSSHFIRWIKKELVFYK